LRHTKYADGSDERINTRRPEFSTRARDARRGATTTTTTTTTREWRRYRVRSFSSSFFFFFFFDDDDARERETDDASVHHATSSYPRAETTRRMDDGDGDARGWGRGDSMGEREDPSRASFVVLVGGVVESDDR